MRLLRVQIRNFRNFREVDCALGGNVVLLGENGAGKSNLLFAMRLLLDPDLPDSSRYLSEEDFWDGGPAFHGTEISVSIDVTSYSDQKAVLACLADHEVKPPPGWTSPVARLTYKYSPRSTVPEDQRPSTTKEHYEFAIYGRDQPSNSVGHDVRRYLGFRVLHALRDAESDLRAWRRSPLRPLIEDASAALDPAAVKSVAAAIDQATNGLTTQPPLDGLGTEIRARLTEMIGSQHSLAPTLGFNPTDPDLLVRTLQLFVDAARRRQVANTSLGLANVLYLALLLLNAEHDVKRFAAAATVIGIEEPEAHLHPQLQRLVFRHLLGKNLPVIVSTHSPNIASVAPVDSLAVIRSVGNESRIATLASSPNFTSEELADLSRYLDVTRAEILFGRGIVLVEGDAERFLIPAAASLFSPPIRLDEFGISVCSVSGTDFVPYAKLLSALDIPFVVITDGDERDPKDGTTKQPGLARAAAILKAIRHPRADELAASIAEKKLLTRLLLQDADVFVGHRTLEADLVAAGAGPRLRACFKELFPTSRDETSEAFVSATTLTDATEDRVIDLVERAGKGRFAQTLSRRLLPTDIPPYISLALQSIVKKCRHA